MRTILGAIAVRRTCLLVVGRSRSSRCHGVELSSTLSNRDFQRTITTFPEDTTVLFFSNLYPESNASAAGVRTSYMLEKLIQSPGVSSVHYATAAVPREVKSQNRLNLQQLKKENRTKPKLPNSTFPKHLEEMGIQFHSLPPNRSRASQFLLQNKIPQQSANLLVIFDRFYAEEMYSFQVYKYAAENSVLVLDMQDMHSLRWARQEYIQQLDHLRKQKERVGDDDINNDGLADLTTDVRPTVNDSRVLRELSSIHRCDLTLVCSKTELEMLAAAPYGISNEKLCLAPLFGDYYANNGNPQATFVNRQDFVFVGGFRHDPNTDAVLQLKRLWPKIRHELLQSTVHDFSNVKLQVYGAYCPDHLQRKLHDPENGFCMNGFHSAPVNEILCNRRVMLAPLRFGAGIKGKIVDAWKNDLPVVTTPIGSEGMEGSSNTNEMDWGGHVARNDDDFVRAAIHLYENQVKHERSVSAMPSLLQQLCGNVVWKTVAESLVKTLMEKDRRRYDDFSRAILWHQSNRSTEYFSKYIEYKEQNKSYEEDTRTSTLDK